MTDRIAIHGLHVATPLFRFIEDQMLPAVGVKSQAFWAGFDGIVKDLAPVNIALLAERDRIQLEMDKWHTANPGPVSDVKASPERLAFDAHSRQHLIFDKTIKWCGHVEPVDGNAIGHRSLFSKIKTLLSRIEQHEGNT